MSRFSVFNFNIWFSLFSRQSGQRVGDYLDKIIPIIINYSNVEGDDELRETCIQVNIECTF